MKTLQEYLDCLKPLVLEGSSLHLSQKISGVTNDSRKAEPGFLFIAIKGASSDGHNFIGNALTRGAVAVIHSKPLEKYSPCISYLRVNDSYTAYAFASECFFNFPARSFELAGITGTNGKTTTAYILKSMLEKSLFKCGFISTVAYSTGESYIEGSRTTPEAWELQKLFDGMRKNSCQKVVMEVSSHGLDQTRTASARFKAAVFTNLTGDHLDYHRDMENYFNAKKRLFTEFLHDNGKAVINIDDPYSQKIVQLLPPEKVISLGTSSSADCRIFLRSASAAGSDCEFLFREKTIHFRSNLIGIHNMYNLASAFLAAIAMGVPEQKAVDVLEAEHHVPGRLERYESPSGAFFFVDYAHTDDALHNVLSAMRALNPRKIITVFGCGGDRDKTKRPRMGLAAANYSDHLIVTSDNPRNEDPSSILNDIIKGIPPETSFEVIADRAEAIKKAVKMAQKNDVVLVAGKGHESYQEVKGKLFDFSDSAELLKAFKAQES
ncbi:MAG: UDP-N-acetylmuramoyl-L-alanyl-D-glutamate--2,6-diaminopimelate ligase [Lentisphaerae bacterium GWF2_45_14]|nr:MAG: UDP-N-acetylmuramoyl-L-alanyl-D-glutamate--2,6-diaminopimelate ligase [Lentisphaerae bacterium GWF2_45_14]